MSGKWSMREDWISDPPDLEKLDLADRDDLEEFLHRYLDVMDGGDAFSQILAVIANSPRTECYVETDYIDRDYRDEYAGFYSGTYRAMFDRCQRLHFVSRGEEDRYLGFVVLRPIPGRPVCRTLIAPPPALAPFVSCVGIASANLYGAQQEVKAAPFISQDFQFGVCAHASIWMVAQYFNLRFGFPRLHMSDIVKAASSQPGNYRTVPSRGLTPQQIKGAMDSLGMLPLNYGMRDSASRSDAKAIARAYLDSGIPVLLTSRGHVYVLIGYFHDENGKLWHVVHDDTRGPYQLFDGFERGERLLAPSPGRVYLEVMAAEKAAQFHFNELMGTDAIAKRMEPVPGESLQLRSYLTEISDYRSALADRGLTPQATAWLSISGASHWVWVVELQDRRLAANTRECVLGEMVVDATTDDRHAHVLFGLMPGYAYRWSEPKRGRESRLPVDQVSPYESGCAIHSVG